MNATKELLEVSIQPLGKRLVVLPDEQAKTSKGGIVLPDQAKEIPCRGTVLAVGADCWRDDSRQVLLNEDDAVERGDRVIYERYAGVEIETNGVKVRILTDEQVLAKITE